MLANQGTYLKLFENTSKTLAIKCYEILATKVNIYQTIRKKNSNSIELNGGYYTILANLQKRFENL